MVKIKKIKIKNRKIYIFIYTYKKYGDIKYTNIQLQSAEYK